jgi:hydrogenase maturation protease
VKTLLDQIVNAVLYEGYILYPYRASSQKNQRERFTFGRVYPQAYSENQNGTETFTTQAECLMRANGDSPLVRITVGFLQPMRREIGLLAKPLTELSENVEPEFKIVSQLEANGKIFQTWTEAVERKVSVALSTDDSSQEIPFTFVASRNLEPIRSGDSSAAQGECEGVVEPSPQTGDSNSAGTGDAVGVILRHQELLEGMVIIKTEVLGKNLFKLSVRVANHSPLTQSDLENSDSILQKTFASTHIIFESTNGEFVSLLETPPELKHFADSCKNVGVWPVLVGDEVRRERTTMLASPIILYDYPQIAPESAGDFFDGTEMDEMLTLRVLTMTDNEKREMDVDDFSRRILERTHALDAEGFLKLHGVMREVKPPSADIFSSEEFFNPSRPVKSVIIEGREMKTGDRVSIRPKRRADVMDMMLSGKTAIIEALEQDAEGKIHLALVLEDDPGRDMGMARQSGHRFFYGTDEVGLLKEEVGA